MHLTGICHSSTQKFVSQPILNNYRKQAEKKKVYFETRQISSKGKEDTNVSTEKVEW